MNILITQGDPRGIGPEVIVKVLKKISKSKRNRLTIIGEKAVFLKYGWDFNLCNLIPLTLNKNRIKFSEIEAAKSSFKALELSMKLIERGNALGVVTAPISKKAWIRAGINYKGHTEYFRIKFKKDFLMCFSKNEFNAGLLTEHIPLKNVSKYVTVKNLVSKSLMLIDMIKRKGCGKKIVFSGLNPHCGEEGVIGEEEIKSIKPAIKKLKKFNIKAYGPFNPEDIFKTCKKLNSNAALFMYHDQILSLIKILDGKNDVVHITWGLGFVRTSPTHGTAFDIAGKNIADETSMLKAIEEAFILCVER